MSEPKKRGRPRKSLDIPTESSAAEEASRPKKRGRPPKTHDAEPEAEANSDDQRPRKRVRAPGGEPDETPEEPDNQPKSKKRNHKAPQPNAGEATVEKSTDTSTRRRRGRPPAGKNARRASDPSEPAQGAAPAARPEEGKQSANQTRKRSQPTTGKGNKSTERPSAPEPPSEKALPKAGQSKPTRPSPPAAEGSGARRSTRDRHSAEGIPGWSAQAGEGTSKDVQPENLASDPPKKAKRGRPSLKELAISRAQNKSNPPAKEKESAAPAEPKKRGRQRSSGAAQEERGQSGDAPAPRGRPRQSDHEEPSLTEQPAGPLAKYRHLASRTRHIPKSTITAKWSALDDAAITAIDGIMADATRPVLFRLRERDQRHQQAQTILRMFGKRLNSKLVKGMPFPPPSVGTATGRKAATSPSTGHEAELDFDRTVEAIQSAEKMLDPLLHSVALLTAEKAREEAALEKEYRLLKTLEVNARAEARGWRERGKRDHALAPDLKAVEEESREDKLKVVATKRPLGSGVFEGLEDEDLVALSKQIGSHMESLKGNLQQIDGVLPAIVKTRAALQGVLHEYLDPPQFDQVVLG